MPPSSILSIYAISSASDIFELPEKSTIFCLNRIQTTWIRQSTQRKCPVGCGTSRLISSSASGLSSSSPRWPGDRAGVEGRRRHRRMRVVVGWKAWRKIGTCYMLKEYNSYRGISLFIIAFQSILKNWSTNINQPYYGYTRLSSTKRPRTVTPSLPRYTPCPFILSFRH